MAESLHIYYWEHLHVCSGYVTQVSEPWPVGLLLTDLSPHDAGGVLPFHFFFFFFFFCLFVCCCCLFFFCFFVFFFFFCFSPVVLEQILGSQCKM